MRSTAARPATWTTTLTIAGLLCGLALIAGSAPASSHADLGAATLQAAPEVPDFGSWTSQAAFPLAAVVRSCGAYFPDNGKFYVLGGRTTDTAGSDLQNPREYDPVLNSWATKTAAFADNQVNNMVGGVLEFSGTDYIVVVGGSAAGAAVATAEVRQYDPVADSMTTLALDAWPGNVGGTILPGGAAVFENRLYVFGGFNISLGMVDTIWRFDPALAAGSRWTQMTATLPAQLGYIPVAASGNYIYGFGGSLWDGATLQDSTTSWRYDPTLDSISAIVPAIPRATAETRAVTQIDGRIWVLGGGRTSPNPSAEVDIYDPVLNSWSVAPSLLTARRNFPADIVPANGEIFTVGGYAGTTPSAVNEKYSAVIFNDGFESSDTSAWSLTVP